MNIQLFEITSLLNKKSVQYWLDNGTLLGIIRDGDVICGDGDIDIGIWSEALEVLQKALQTINNRYKIFYQTFQGNIIKISLIPRTDKKLLRVDFHVYRLAKGYAWCPSYIVQKRAFRRWSFMFVFEELRRRFLLYIRVLRRKILKHEEIYSFLLRPILRYRVWWIPAKYFQKQERIGQSSLLIPQEAEKYLELHYGNWRVPVQTWNYWLDDKTLAPLDVID